MGAEGARFLREPKLSGLRILDGRISGQVDWTGEAILIYSLPYFDSLEENIRWRWLKIKRTPLYHRHEELEASMTDFGGWEMPVEYEGIIEEHRNVRKNCGLFDVSHMGEIFLTGERAADCADYLLTNSIADMSAGTVVYSPMCYEHGGVVDDLMIYRMAEDEFLLVVNAANREKDFEWIKEKSFTDVEVDDRTEEYALLALQGPAAEETLDPLADCDLGEIKPFQFSQGEISGVDTIISRTGYTGEDGFELYFAAEEAENVWQQIMEAGESHDIQPAGLGARDTLRLEKTLCLYGHELSEEIHPLMANLSWTVDFDGGDFIGREALVEIREEGYEKELAGFIVRDRGIARNGYAVFSGDKEIGEVTSGSYSPSLEENIGLAYIDKDYSEAGKEIEIEVRGRSLAAEIVETPFI